jgi:hypothetical protein
LPTLLAEPKPNKLVSAWINGPIWKGRCKGFFLEIIFIVQIAERLGKKVERGRRQAVWYSGEFRTQEEEDGYAPYPDYDA